MDSKISLPLGQICSIAGRQSYGIRELEAVKYKARQATRRGDSHLFHLAKGDTRGLTILGYPFLCHSICINGTFASCGATTISNLIEWVRTLETVFKRRL